MIMQWIDVLILCIIFISALVSMVRGFVREALSLAGWIAAIWIGLRFAQHLAELFLVNYIALPSLRIIVAFTALFVITLFLSAMVNFLASQIVKKTGLSGTDRVIGVVFGLLRGGVAVGILVFLAGLTSLPQDPWWKESLLIGYFQNFAVWMGNSVSPELLAKFSVKNT